MENKKSDKSKSRSDKKWVPPMSAFGSREGEDGQSIEEQIKIKAGQARGLARYMSSTQDLVEEQIRKAREKGAFDNLKGSGEPLDLEENPFEPPEMRMVFRLLKNSNFTPHWIEIGKDIDAEYDKIWRDVAKFERYARVFFSGRKNEAALQAFQRKKELLYMDQRNRFEKLYMRVVDFNLHCPTFREGRANLDIEREMNALIDRVECKIKELKMKYGIE